MSVTFFISALGAGITTPHTIDSIDCDAYDTNGMCAMYGCHDYKDLGVNLANTNACRLLNALDLYTDEWYAGSIDPTDLRGRVLMALALADDTAIAPAVDGGEGTGRAMFIDCGTDAGYLTGKLNLLMELCDQAESIGSPVLWG